MKDDKVFGIVYRFGYNDYQISLMDFEDVDAEIIDSIMMKYSDDCTCERGDRTLSLEDANVTYFDKEESMWAVTYKAAGHVSVLCVQAEGYNTAKDEFFKKIRHIFLPKDVKILSCVPSDQ